MTIPPIAIEDMPTAPGVDAEPPTAPEPRDDAAQLFTTLYDDLRRLARREARRGGAFVITSLDTEHAEQVANPEALQEIGDALDELAKLEPELAEVVDLKFFCGLTLADIANMKGVSERTVQRQWDKARMLLHRTLAAR